jgi:hypothetical protein
MGCFSFTADITEKRSLTLPTWSPTGRVTVAITPVEDETPSGRWLLAKPQDLQSAIPARESLSKEPIDAALENDRASWSWGWCPAASGAHPIPWPVAIGGDVAGADPRECSSHGPHPDRGSQWLAENSPTSARSTWR